MSAEAARMPSLPTGTVTFLFTDWSMTMKRAGAPTSAYAEIFGLAPRAQGRGIPRVR